MVGIAERWQSSRIGEGLILDLRRSVFGHVQRMPVAFFTRTRTGALVSRLNNDVIGAQRAFTWTLSGVVSNFITLLLTLAVMLRLSWAITLLALVLLPVFVIPARRMGARLAHLEREAADHNAAMTTLLDRGRTAETLEDIAHDRGRIALQQLFDPGQIGRLPGEEMLGAKGRKVVGRVGELHRVRFFGGKIDQDLVEEKIPFGDPAKSPAFVQAVGPGLKDRELVSLTGAQFPSFNKLL